MFLNFANTIIMRQVSEVEKSNVWCFDGVIMRMQIFPFFLLLSFTLLFSPTFFPSVDCKYFIITFLSPYCVSFYSVQFNSKWFIPCIETVFASSERIFFLLKSRKRKKIHKVSLSVRIGSNSTNKFMWYNNFALWQSMGARQFTPFKKHQFFFYRVFFSSLVFFLFLFFFYFYLT